MFVNAEGKEYNTKTVKVDFKLIEPDPFNARHEVELELKAGKKGLTLNEQIELYRTDPEIPLMAESVRENGSACMPLFVKKIGSKYRAMNGNRRWFVYYLLNQEGDKKFTKVPTEVYPANMPDSAIDYHINIMHTVGEREWNSYSRAVKQFDYQTKHKVSDEAVCRKFGIPLNGGDGYKSKKAAVEACRRYIRETKERDPKWSYFYEAIKVANTKIPEALKDPATRKLVHQAIQENSFGDVHKVRKLAQIIDKKHALRTLVKYGIDEAVNAASGTRQPAQPFYSTLAKATAYHEKNKRLISDRMKKRETNDMDLMAAHLEAIVNVLQKSGNMFLYYEAADLDVG